MNTTVLIIYGILIVYTLFFSGYKYEKKLLLVPTTVLAAFVGLRGSISGYDYHVYKYFYNLRYSENPFGYEKLYVYLRNIFKLTGADFNIYILFLGIFFSFSTWYIFTKYSENPTLALLTYISTFFIWQNFNILRQFIGILIFYIGIKFILERKMLLYFVVAALATGFHTTGFILFPLYFLLNIRFKRNVMIILAALAGLFMPLSGLIFKINIGFLQIGDRIQRYAGIVEQGSKMSYGELLGIFLFVTAIYFYFTNEGENMSQEENLFYNMTFFSLLLFTAFFRFAVLLRMVEYFRFANIIIFVAAMGKIPNKNLKYISMALFMTYLILRFYKGAIDYGIADYSTWIF